MSDWDRRLELLRHLTSEWPGDSRGGVGFVRILNEQGSKPPLIWCFNAAHEFPALAAALGPDQPVVGMRSLHMVEPISGKRYGQDEATAALYARDILGRLDFRQCTVGGNCQGAGIAIHLATNLMEAGKEIRALITMEAESPFPFAGRVGLIFGANSKEYNPFLRGRSPEAKWRTIYGEPLLEIVSGAHGGYFRGESLRSLCDAIMRIIEKPSTRSHDWPVAPPQISIRLANANISLEAGSRARLPATVAMDGSPAPLKSAGALEAVAVWTSPHHGLWADCPAFPISIPDKAGAHDVAIEIQAPPEPGSWQVQLFACSEMGPLTKTHTFAAKYQATVR